MNEPINLMEYEDRARDLLPETAYMYFATGANDEITLRENQAAYARLKLYPRMLRDVSTRSMAVELFGQTLNAPLITAPMAYNAMAHPDGEFGIVRAAGARGVAVTHSTLATFALEEVIQVASAPLWYQLYAFQDREINKRLIRRAESAGYAALVVTVDTPLIGRRENEIRVGFNQRKGVRAANLLAPEMRDLWPHFDDEDTLAQYISTVRRANLTWDDVRWLRDATHLPLLLKGILRADDAVQAVALGVDGLIISNHGGRQLDGALATIEALPAIAKAVGERVPLIVDGGVRRGSDVLKGLALGARAVMVGRPLLWGLAVNGEAGAGHVLDLLIQELDLAMALCGAATLADITADLVWRG